MEKLFSEGDKFFSTVKAEIKRAREKIIFDFYIFQDDEVGKEISKCLIDAARRAVEVWLVYDRIGSYSTPGAFWHKLEEAGIKVFGYRRSFLFKRLPTKKYTLSKWSFFIAWIKALFLRRDHRKIIVIDERVAFTGGFNIMRENSRKFYGKARWLDVMYMTNDRTIVLELQSLALDTIRRIRDPEMDISELAHKRVAEAIVSDAMVNLDKPKLKLFSRKKVSIARALKFLLRNANQRIYISSPYFIPYGRYLSLLVRKSREKIDVALYLSQFSDHPSLNILAFYFARKILKSGGKVYLYNGRENETDDNRFCHAKIILSDNWVAVGTNNFDRRSIIMNLESLVVRSSPALLKEAQDFFKHLNSHSQQMQYEQLKINWKFWLLYPIRYFL